MHKSAKQMTMMMDFQIDLEGWLEESTLFPNQQICHRPTSDLFPESKDLPAVSSVGDGWLDENWTCPSLIFRITGWNLRMILER